MVYLFLLFYSILNTRFYVCERGRKVVCMCMCVGGGGKGAGKHVKLSVVSRGGSLYFHFVLMGGSQRKF